MARITVEDCVTVVPNRFELCLVASSRAKSILSGAATNLDRKEKPAVISLREIGDKMIDVKTVKENILRSIKNRGVIETVVNDNQVSEAVLEEIESNNVLKEGTFLDQNVEAED